MASIFMCLTTAKGDKPTPEAKYKGESLQTDHIDWIPIESASWGHSRTVQGAKAAQRTRGETHVQDIVVSQMMNRASMALQQRSAAGETTKFIYIDFCRTGADPAKGLETYLRIICEDALLSSYSTGIAGENIPIETFSVDYLKVTMEYYVADKAGKLKKDSEFTWDKETGTAA